MRSLRMFVVCLGLGLTMWTSSAWACEMHEMPMPEPMDACELDSDCGDGQCTLMWLDGYETACDANDWDCYEVTRCVAPAMPEPPRGCESDAMCGVDETCALPFCPEGGCPEEVGVCVASDEDAAVPEGVRGGDASVFGGCQGGSAPVGMPLFALLGLAFLGLRARARASHRPV